MHSVVLRGYGLGWSTTVSASFKWFSSKQNYKYAELFRRLFIDEAKRKKIIMGGSGLKLPVLNFFLSSVVKKITIICITDKEM